MLSALMAHPDAIWRVGEGEEYRSTMELLQHLTAEDLDQRIVRVDEYFYRLEPCTHEASRPLLTLVDTWNCDHSLADALQHGRCGFWLDGNGVAWTADQLLDLLTLEQLGTPVEAESPHLSAGERTAVCEKGGSILFVHIGVEDGIGTAIESVWESKGSWTSGANREAHDWDLPFWPPTGQSFVRSTSDARQASSFSLS